jgi:hypothetical protein
MSTHQREDDSWYQTIYERLVCDSTTQRRALEYAIGMRRDADPELSLSDVHAARAYLRACMFNMTPTELHAKKPDELAALWGRGALGAARYRSRDPQIGKRRKRRLHEGRGRE